MWGPACAELSILDRVAVSQRHAGQLIHYVKASRRRSRPHGVSLGLSAHEPHQQRHVRMQDCILQADDGSSPQKLSCIVLHELQGTPEDSGKEFSLLWMLV